MKRKSIILSLMLCLAVICSCAFSVSAETSDPTLKITFTKTAAEQKTGAEGSLTFSSDDFQEGTLFVGDNLYDINETYLSQEIIDPSYEISGEGDRFESDGIVYALTPVKNASPGSLSDPSDETKLVCTNEYRLIPAEPEEVMEPVEVAAVEEPVAEDPVVEKPVAEEPVAVKPAEEKPAEKPAQEIPEERFSTGNPILIVGYKEDTLALSIQTSDEELRRAVLDTGDEAFPVTGDSKIEGKLTKEDISSARVSTGTSLYKLSLINSGAITEDPGSITLKYELIPSDEKMTDRIETVDHEKTDLKYVNEFFVNGEPVSSSKYRKVHLKNRCYEEEFKSDDTVEIEPMVETMAYEGKDVKKINEWVIDRYFHYEKTMTITHKLYVLAARADEKFIGFSHAESSRASFLPLKARQKSTGYSESSLRWNKVKGVEEYIVYVSQCGDTNYRKAGQTKGSGLTIRHLKKNTYYKYIVVAVDKHGKILHVSPTVHIATKDRHTNPRNFKLKKSSFRIKKGKTEDIKYSVNYRGVNIHYPVRFESTDRRIATVSDKGRIKAKRKGTCYIYAYTQNGRSKRIKVRVR